MKVQNLFNYQMKTQKNANNNPNFKSLSPAAKTKLIEVSSGPAKEVFVKLSAMAGLTGIVTFLHSCINNEPTQEDKANLENLANNAKERADSYLTNPETIDLYLETTSNADATEASVWAKGLTAQPIKVAKSQYNEESRANLLSKDYGEVYLEQVSNKRLESILSQSKVISASNKYEELSAILDSNLQGLVQEADKLSKNDKLSDVYSKISSIIKMTAIANFIEAFITKKDSEVGVPVVKTTDVASDIVEQSKSIQQEVETKSDVITAVSEQEIPIQGADKGKTTGEKPLDITTSEEVSIVGPTVLGKIDLGDTKGYYSRMKDKEEQANVGPKIVETKENKEFVKIFRQAFSSSSHIIPELYADKINYIQKIYDSYAGKENMETLLLKVLSEEDNRKMVNLYYDLTDGSIEKIDFLSFYKIQQNIRAHGGDMSKKEFDELNGYKNSYIKYYAVQLYSKGDTKVKIPFLESYNEGNKLSFDKKLEMLKRCYQIIFNVSEANLISGAKSSVSTEENIKNELIEKILSGKENDYLNIIDFLELDETLMETVQSEIDEGDLDSAKIDLNKILLNSNVKNRFYDLIDIVNNKAFDGIIDSTHGKMRFLDRILFNDDPELVAKPKKAIKQATTRQINRLKELIESSSEAVLTEYEAKRPDGTSVHKKGVQIVISENPRYDYVLGLDKNAKIHTILKKQKTKIKK